MRGPGSSVPVDALILKTIRRSRRRLVTVQLADALIELAAFALLYCLAFGTLAQDRGWGAGAWGLGLVLLGLLGVAYLGLVGLRGSSLKSVAIVLDRRLGFHDRVSSALAFLGVGQRTSFMEAHLAETAAFLEQHGQQVIPMDWPRQSRALAVFLALLLVALLPHSDRSALKELDRRTRIETKVKAAQNLVRELKELRAQADLRGLKKLSEMVAAAEQSLQAQIDLLRPEDTAPPPKPEAKDRSDAAGNSPEDRNTPDEADPVAAAANGQGLQEGMRLSATPTYQPVGKFDAFPEATYAAVFAELDGLVVDTPMTGLELKAMAEHVDDAAGKLGNFGYFQGTQGDSQESQRRGAFARQKDLPDNSIESEQAALGYKAFSEFMKRYAAHLGEKAMGQARMEMSDKENTGGETINVSAPPPKDAKFAIQGVSDQRPEGPILQATEAQMQQVAAALKTLPGATPKSGVKGSGTELGGSGAGVGAADHSGTAPAILPRAEGGSYLPLKGKLGDGDSLIQVIHDRGKRNLPTPVSGEVSYREVFVEYAHGAEAELNSEQVPAHMRDYIRDYFRSIRPAAEAAPEPPAPGP